MRRGLSVVETVLSLGMVTLLLFLILSLFPSAMLSVRSGEHRLQAETLAASILDAQATRPFSELTPAPAEALVAQVYDGVTYEPTLAVRRVPGEQHCMSVRATVRWEGHELVRELYLQDLTD